jgi:hypothetical protein
MIEFCLLWLSLSADFLFLPDSRVTIQKLSGSRESLATQTARVLVGATNQLADIIKFRPSRSPNNAPRRIRSVVSRASDEQLHAICAKLSRRVCIAI